MTAWIKLLFSLLLIVAVSFSAHAQKDRKSQLRIRKVEIMDEIQLANKILVETRKNEKMTVGELRTLNTKIQMREELIHTINREIRIINKEIKVLQQSVDTLEQKIEKLKVEYADMIRQAYLSRNKNSKLMFVLSSSDFSQAMKRATYLKQYADHRENQVNEIKDKLAELEAKIAELEARKQKQRALKGDQENEKSNLVEEKEEQQEVADDLKNREREIQSEIKQKQKEADKLEKEIEKIITEELRKAREKAQRTALEKQAKELGLRKGKDYTSRTSSKKLKKLIDEKRKSLNIKTDPVEETAGPSYQLTPAARQLAANFVANKGRLPWPVERGIIVGKFGVQPIPGMPGLKENNPHIEIATEPGTEARAAFEGEVARIIRIPGANKAVLVRHGNYFTIYGNLIDVYIKEGQQLSTKQRIGKVYTDKQKQTVLQFGLWKDDQIQNPQPWLAK